MWRFAAFSFNYKSFRTFCIEQFTLNAHWRDRKPCFFFFNCQSAPKLSSDFLFSDGPWSNHVWWTLPLENIDKCKLKIVIFHQNYFTLHVSFKKMPKINCLHKPDSVKYIKFCAPQHNWEHWEEMFDLAESNRRILCPAACRLMSIKVYERTGEPAGRAGKNINISRELITLYLYTLTEVTRSMQDFYL